MTKKIILSAVFVLFTAVLSAQVISRHGLVLNGGIGSLSTTFTDKDLDMKYAQESYKSGYAIGYRFRFNHPAPQRFHYDCDLNFGVKLWNYLYLKKAPDEGNTDYGYGYEVIHDGTAIYGYASIGGTANYSVIKNLSIGLGIEPTYFFMREGQWSENKYDIPLVGKIAYNFNFLEVGISYKYGLMNVLETDFLKSGKFREVQLSLFIPF